MTWGSTHFSLLYCFTQHSISYILLSTCFLNVSRHLKHTTFVGIIQLKIDMLQKRLVTLKVKIPHRLVKFRMRKKKKSLNRLCHVWHKNMIRLFLSLGKYRKKWEKNFFFYYVWNVSFDVGLRFVGEKKSWLIFPSFFSCVLFSLQSWSVS